MVCVIVGEYFFYILVLISMFLKDILVMFIEKE